MNLDLKNAIRNLTAALEAAEISPGKTQRDEVDPKLEAVWIAQRVVSLQLNEKFLWEHVSEAATRELTEQIEPLFKRADTLFETSPQLKGQNGHQEIKALLQRIYGIQSGETILQQIEAERRNERDGGRPGGQRR